ncbi:MAG TPA: hypothetical protein VJ249_09030 [Candidatus Bathyarchaeia archaeon]|nr:hypothetical protein [Candidatus Bathyarchaeia archaeon]
MDKYHVDKYGKLFIIMMSILTGFLLFELYQSLKLTDGGFTSSSQVIAILPLVVQANVSLLAFWGLMLTFRTRELSSQRIELMRNLWEIGFKRDELRVKIEEATEEKELLKKLYEELGKDAKIRKGSIAAFYEWETSIMYLGLFAAVFFVLSISSGLYGISMTFHAELVDPLTYFTPFVCLFFGVVATMFALLSSTYRIGKSLETR